MSVRFLLSDPNNLNKQPPKDWCYVNKGLHKDQHGKACWDKTGYTSINKSSIMHSNTKRHAFVPGKLLSVTACLKYFSCQNGPLSLNKAPLNWMYISVTHSSGPSVGSIARYIARFLNLTLHGMELGHGAVVTFKRVLTLSCALFAHRARAQHATRRFQELWEVVWAAWWTPHDGTKVCPPQQNLSMVTLQCSIYHRVLRQWPR